MLHEDAIEDAPSLTTGNSEDEQEPTAPKVQQGKPFPPTKRPEAVKSFKEAVLTETEHEVHANILGLKPNTGKHRKFAYPKNISYGGRSWTQETAGGERWKGSTMDGVKYRDQYGNILTVTQTDEPTHPIQEGYRIVEPRDLKVGDILGDGSKVVQPMTAGVVTVQTPDGKIIHMDFWDRKTDRYNLAIIQESADLGSPRKYYIHGADETTIRSAAAQTGMRIKKFGREADGTQYVIVDMKPASNATMPDKLRTAQMWSDAVAELGLQLTEDAKKSAPPDVPDAPRCPECGKKPDDPKWEPYCCGVCAINAERA